MSGLNLNMRLLICQLFSLAHAILGHVPPSSSSFFRRIDFLHKTRIRKTVSYFNLPCVFISASSTAMFFLLTPALIAVSPFVVSGMFSSKAPVLSQSAAEQTALRKNSLQPFHYFPFVCVLSHASIVID